MTRGPLCGTTNPSYVRTPGPIGSQCPADPNGEITLPRNRLPLGFDGDGNRAQPKMVAQASPQKKAGNTVNAVSALALPAADIIRQLQSDIDRVLKLDQQYVAKNEAKDEPLRLAKEKVVHAIAKAYRVGLKHVSGMEFSNRLHETDYANTQGTFITVFDPTLTHPGFVANIVMHESSHAQRNDELATAGVDRSKFSVSNEARWVALIEFEGAQLEIDHAAKTGITETEKNSAISLRDGHLKDIETFLGRKARAKVESGGIDEVRGQFIQTVKSAKKRP